MRKLVPVLSCGVVFVITFSRFSRNNDLFAGARQRSDVTHSNGIDAPTQRGLSAPLERRFVHLL